VRALAILILVGCAGYTTVAHPRNLGVEGKVADPVLDSLPPDLDWFDGFRNDVEHSPRTAACLRGDRRSCWRASAWSELALWAVEDNCRAGHQLSCRAAKSWGLPGAEGTNTLCNVDSPESCDFEKLVVECEQGFPLSCDKLLTLLPDQLVLEWLFAERTFDLLREGCAIGIESECSTLARQGSRRDRLLAYEEMCRQYSRSCIDLAEHLIERHDPDRARRIAEAACEMGHSRHACEWLGIAYLRHQLAEPVVGRGQQLLERSCKATVAAEGWHSNEPERTQRFSECLDYDRTARD
jgi:hypothetical protein